MELAKSGNNNEGGLKEWTDQEEQIVIREIKKSPDNLSKAFEKASFFLDRSQHAISCHWYSKMKPTMEDEIFCTSSDNETKVNGKNTKRETTKPEVIKALNSLFESLSYSEKRQFLINKTFG